MRSGYLLRLIAGDGTALRFPVLPEKLQVSSPGKDRTQEVLGLGEVLRLRPRGLRTVKWEGLLPVQSAPYVDGTVAPPASLIRWIEGARDQRQPLGLQLLGGELELPHRVAVTGLDYEERAGEVGDVYYSIELTEWRAHQALELVLRPETQELEEGPTPRSGAPAAPKNYTVARRDSLWAIAKRSYGDGSRWRGIYDANRGAIGPDPNKIYPGQVLTLP